MTDTLNKEEFVEKLSGAIVDGYDLNVLKNIVWDQTYDELIRLGWGDLKDYAETFAPELLE
jgi:hypothetical protein